jgi:5-methylcytosine-specific restriction endonuclease McrA
MSDRRTLTPDEKATLIQRYGMRCFIDGHPIEAETDLEFDHIKPVAARGATELENLAPVCRKHNRQKGTMSLSEYRDYLSLSRFFNDAAPSIWTTSS